MHPRLERLFFSVTSSLVMVSTLVYTADWSRTLLYRDDTMFTAN